MRCSNGLTRTLAASWASIQRQPIPCRGEQERVLVCRSDRPRVEPVPHQGAELAELARLGGEGKVEAASDERVELEREDGHVVVA